MDDGHQVIKLLTERPGADQRPGLVDDLCMIHLRVVKLDAQQHLPCLLPLLREDESRSFHARGHILRAGNRHSAAKYVFVELVLVPHLDCQHLGQVPFREFVRAVPIGFPVSGHRRLRAGDFFAVCRNYRIRVHPADLGERTLELSAMHFEAELVPLMYDGRRDDSGCGAWSGRLCGARCAVRSVLVYLQARNGDTRLLFVALVDDDDDISPAGARAFARPPPGLPAPSPSARKALEATLATHSGHSSWPLAVAAGVGQAPLACKRPRFLSPPKHTPPSRSGTPPSRRRRLRGKQSPAQAAERLKQKYDVAPGEGRCRSPAAAPPPAQR
mmetsp:Transcript_1311/g.3951  ORF Transcript_1311/g.3951 Transcript_1311/m.3951 type:complete len:329 (-) Transcript_1311:19-1005(-)